jgi:siroheme synthase
LQLVPAPEVEVALGQEIAVGELVEEELVVRRQDCNFVVVIGIWSTAATNTTTGMALVVIFVASMARSFNGRFGLSRFD